MTRMDTAKTRLNESVSLYTLFDDADPMSIYPSCLSMVAERAKGMMHTFAVRPEASLRMAGHVSVQFLTTGISDFRGAAAYVNRLPYGRNTNREDGRTVLEDGRGTCSTKHALLAALAAEQGIDEVILTLGMFEMTDRNAPGVGGVLSQHELPYMPEAHCYLRYRNMRIDVTRSGQERSEPIAKLMYEETIRPDQIGAYKTNWHQRLIQHWVTMSNHAGGRSWEEVWRIREACLVALSQ